MRAALTAALERERLLLREPASATRRATEAHLHALGIRPRHPVELGHTEAIKRAVAAGMGLAFVSRYAAAPEIAAGSLGAADGPAARIPRRLYFIHPKGTRLSPAALAFLSFAGKGLPGKGGASPWRTSGSRSA